jgi:hypothetical protein
MIDIFLCNSAFEYTKACECEAKAKEKFCNFSIFFYCPFWLDFIAFFNALFDFQLSWKMQFEMQVMLLTYSKDGEKKKFFTYGSIIELPYQNETKPPCCDREA